MFFLLFLLYYFFTLYYYFKADSKSVRENYHLTFLLPQPSILCPHPLSDGPVPWGGGDASCAAKR